MINFAIHDLKVGWRKRVIDQRDWKEENGTVVILYTGSYYFRFCAYLLYSARVMYVGGHKPGVNKSVLAYE